MLLWRSGLSPIALNLRCDVFGLGVIGCEIFLGRHPFSDDVGLKLTERMQNERVPVPSGLPAGLRPLLQSMTDPNPEARPSAGEVKADLERLL